MVNSHTKLIITMVLGKTAVTPLLTHWRYCSLALNHWYKTTHTSIMNMKPGTRKIHTPKPMTSWWARLRLKSPASRLFIEGADQRKHQSFPSPAFVRGIHRWPVNYPHKAPVTRKMFPFDDAIKTDCDGCSDLYAKPHRKSHIDGLAQDCSNSSALSVELLQSGVKPSTCEFHKPYLLTTQDPGNILHQVWYSMKYI